MSEEITPADIEAFDDVYGDLETHLSDFDCHCLKLAFARHRLKFTPASAGVLVEALEARDTAQSAVEAWAEVCEGLEAHLQDRVAMQDEANPAAYLSILRSIMANVHRASVQIRAARWADYNRQSAEIDRLRQALSATATPASDGVTAGAQARLDAWHSEWLESNGDHWGDHIEWGTAREIVRRLVDTIPAVPTPDRFGEGYRAGVEASAKVADECADHEGPFTDYFKGRDQGCHDAAKAIRALLPATEQSA